MIAVTDQLSFSGEFPGCTEAGNGQVAVVHACKDPCYRQAVGCASGLVFERGHHLFLNLIDPDKPLFLMPSFEAFLSFVDRKILERPVHIHCNRGESRAPTLTLLYMAKRLGLLPNDSYESAAAAFSSWFPYRPGAGIKEWLLQNWRLIETR